MLGKNKRADNSSQSEVLNLEFIFCCVNTKIVLFY